MKKMGQCVHFPLLLAGLQGDIVFEIFAKMVIPDRSGRYESRMVNADLTNIPSETAKANAEKRRKPRRCKRPVTFVLPPFKNRKFTVESPLINSIQIDPEPIFMAEKVYEGLFIFDSDLYARGADEISSQVATIVEQFGGEVLLSRLWDERKLEYPIKGHRRGTYWLAYFKMNPSDVKELTRQFQLSDSIIRFLIISVDPRLVDTLVEHARAGRQHAGHAQAEILDEIPPVSIIEAVNYVDNDD